MLRSSTIATVAFRGGESSSDPAVAITKGVGLDFKDVTIRVGRAGDDCRGGELICMLEGPPFSASVASGRLTAHEGAQTRTTGTST
eukprot:evm.model.NODE_31567_length_81678_cov_30.212677.2